MCISMGSSFNGMLHVGFKFSLNLKVGVIFLEGYNLLLEIKVQGPTNELVRSNAFLPKFGGKAPGD